MADDNVPATAPAGLATAAAPVSRRASPEEEAITTERRAALLTAIQALSERDRRVVACRYLLELSEADTAAVLAVPLGTVKSELSRALRRLRAAPTPAGYVHEEVTERG